MVIHIHTYKVKILLYIALYKRPEITKMCFDNIEFIKEFINHDIDVFCVVSTEEDASICEQYGYDYHFTENKPLGKKMNVGLKSVLKKDFDVMMQCGSNDILTLDYFEFIEDDLQKKTPYFGVRTSHVVDKKTGSVKMWRLEINHPIGLGRCFTKETLLNATKQSELWPNDIDSGLDNNSDVSMLYAGYRCKILDSEKPMLFGIKSGFDIHSFNETPGKLLEWKLENLTV